MSHAVSFEWGKNPSAGTPPPQKKRTKWNMIVMAAIDPMKVIEPFRQTFIKHAADNSVNSA